MITRPTYVPPVRLVAVSRAELAKIVKRFGIGLLTDMETSLDGMPRSSRGEKRVAFLRLLKWVATQPEEPVCRSFMEVYRDRGRAANGYADTQMVTQVLLRLNAAWVAERGSNLSTPYRDVRHAAAILAAMVSIRAGAPAFKSRHLKLRKPAGAATPTLGSLPWDEIEGLSASERETRALFLVRDGAATWFSHCSEMFSYGQGVLREDLPDSVDEGSWRAVKQLLSGARARLIDRAAAPIGQISVLSAGDASLLRRATWLRAGLSEQAAERWFPASGEISRIRLGAVALRCICASPDAARSLSVMIACATALNRAPIAGLPRPPVTFRTREAFGMATTGFISSFKARAGKTVVASLLDARPLLGLVGDRAVAAWNQTAKDFMDEDEREGGALVSLHEHADLLDAIERFEQMAEAARAIDPGCRRSSRFLIYPSVGKSPSGRLWLVDKAGMSGRAPGILGRPGVTFPAIRATIAAIDHHRGRSVFSTAAGLCNAPPTAWRHYVAPRYDRGDTMIGFFARLVQALILPDGEAAAIGVDPDGAEATLRIAGVGGLAAALGLSQRVDATAAASAAQPSDDALADLHLALRAAERAQTELPRDVWQVRCRPRFAACTAMLMALKDAGLGTSYESLARRLDAELASGTAVLPINWLG